MKKYRILNWILKILAILLSHMMCATVAYNYCNMQWRIQYAGFSAPASVAFLLVIPYSIGIGACVLLARYFNKKSI